MKLSDKKGFTVLEIITVVCIAALIVALLVPIVNKHLEISREETDIANMVAAEAAAESILAKRDSSWKNASYYYDMELDKLVEGTPQISYKSYGRGTSVDAGYEYENYSGKDNVEGGYIVVDFDENGTFTLTWEGMIENGGPLSRLSKWLFTA